MTEKELLEIEIYTLDGIEVFGWSDAEVRRHLGKDWRFGVGNGWFEEIGGGNVDDIEHPL